MMLVATHWLAWTGCILGAVVLGLFVVLVAPWRRIRSEAPLSDEVQARLLLGEDPADIDRDLAAGDDPAPVSDLHPEE